MDNINNKYKNWIDAYIERTDYLRGKCRAGSNEMAEAFPELKVVFGWVLTLYGEEEHFWCETEDGKIVDPTVGQFLSIGGYRKFNPGDPVRVGKCMNCGSEIYGSITSLEDKKPQLINGAISKCECSYACQKELAEYMN